MFANKVVIVTGGSAGIGAAVAECFAKEGATLAIVGRNETKLKNVAQKCENLGANVLTIKADISVEDEAKTIVKKTIDKFGKLDVLVNNAGIIRFGTILESNMMQFYDEVMNTNLRAVILLTHLAVPYLISSKGNVVNVSSILAKTVFPSMGPYCISKAGMDQFTRCAAVELASSGVRVNSINPGPVASEMLDNVSSSEFMKGKNMEDMTKLGRISEGSEIGDLILYLASDRAKSVTGSCYVIDNGILLN